MPAPPFRPDRQPVQGWLSGLFWLLAVLVGLPFACWLLQRATGSILATKLILVVAATVIVLLVWLYRLGHLPIPGLRAWARRNRWETRRAWGGWPWMVVDGPYGRAVVRVAVSGELSGLPVTVGEVWTRGGTLGGVNERRRRTVIFVVVRLPTAYRSTAVESYAGVPLSEAADEFDRWYRVVAEDPSLADRLASPALRTAHADGRIPPWRIVGDQLYAISTLRAPLLPGKVLPAAEQVLTIAKLLGVGGVEEFGPMEKR